MSELLKVAESIRFDLRTNTTGPRLKRIHLDRLSAAITAHQSQAIRVQTALELAVRQDHNPTCKSWNYISSFRDEHCDCFIREAKEALSQLK